MQSQQSSAESIAGAVSKVTSASHSVIAPVLSTEGSLSAALKAADVLIPTGSRGNVQVVSKAAPPPVGSAAEVLADAESPPAFRVEAVSVGLPHQVDRKDAVVASDGTVTYEDMAGKADLAVQALAEGVRIHAIIKDPSAPSLYTYSLQLPSQIRAMVSSDGSVTAVNNFDGSTLGIVFSAPWAKDANGRDVPTGYSIEGNQLVQHVSLSETEFFPVVAEPWLGITLIDHVSWKFNTDYGPTLSVFPTWYGRYSAPVEFVGALGAVAGATAGWAAWDEVVAKAPSANTNSMRDQFYCHWDWVRLRAPNKPSWNLDKGRPDVGYLTCVKYGCNPPSGPSEF